MCRVQGRRCPGCDRPDRRRASQRGRYQARVLESVRAGTTTAVGVDADAAARAAEEAMLADMLAGLPQQPSRPEPKKPEPKKPEPKKPEPKKPEEPTTTPPMEPVTPTPKPATSAAEVVDIPVSEMTPEERAVARDAARSRYPDTRAMTDEAWAKVGDDRDPDAVRAHVEAVARAGSALALAADTTYHDEIEKRGLTDEKVQELYDAAVIRGDRAYARNFLGTAMGERAKLRKQAYLDEVARMRGESEVGEITKEIETTRTFAKGTGERFALEYGVSAYPKSMMDEALGSLGRLRVTKAGSEMGKYVRADFTKKHVFTARRKPDRLYFDAQGRIAAGADADIVAEAHPDLAHATREDAEKAAMRYREAMDSRGHMGRMMPDPEIILNERGEYILASPKGTMRKPVSHFITDVAPRMRLDDTPANAVHELAHAVEANNERIGAACKRFLYDRTEGLTRHSFAGNASAQVVEDGFASAYTGRDYGGDRNATEVFSTGMEALMGGSYGGLVNEGPTRNTRKFRADPEHRALVLGLLATA